MLYLATFKCRGIIAPGFIPTIHWQWGCRNHSVGPWSIRRKTLDRRFPRSYPNVMALPKYRYVPLDASKNDIRLLRVLFATSHDDPIRCVLFHTTLDEAPPYQALSYSWGDRTTSCPIQVNAGKINVTQNLHDALNRLRPSTPEVELVIWIDAICINQLDIPERSAQTGKMRIIYQRAEKTLVWLGLQDSGSVQAIQLARRLNSCTKKEVKRCLQTPLEDGRYLAVERLVILFRREYWWRIWVVQEILCSKNTEIFCGEDSITWDELENVCEIVKPEKYFLETRIFYRNLSKAHTLTHGGPRSLQLSRYTSTDTNPPLLDLLLTHKSKKSTDARDKVYALVGISSSKDRFGPIDYSQSPAEVFSHTARHIITTTKKLDVSCVKQHSISQYELPSWAPDWTRLPYQLGYAHLGLHHHKPDFCAAGDSVASAEFLNDGKVLKTDGFVIGHIKDVGVPFVKKGSPSEVLPTLHAFSDWLRIFCRYKKISPSTKAEFGRVISCGNLNFTEVATYEKTLGSIADLSKTLVARFGPTSDALSGLDTRALESSNSQKELSAEDEKKAMAATLSVNLMMNRRRLIITEMDISGLAPWDAVEGDKVCILLGCRFPVILRQIGDHYILIGEAYISGFMDGQGMLDMSEGKFTLQSIRIH
ncbi:heterokaryon incompatibility protein-domain-containing protein [Bisporella sp. PMI_857]|nr:heterokaryon incompatibility protein-domain-containing protein [Bisporella sp. PMI_857]